MDNKKQGIDSWAQIKQYHNNLKTIKDTTIKIQMQNDMIHLIKEMADGMIKAHISSFPIDVQDDMYQDIITEIYTSLDTLKVLALGIKEDEKVIKFEKRKSYFTEDEISALIQIETYINDHLNDEAELDRVLTLLNDKYPYNFDYIPQTGYSYCMNYIKKVCGIYDASIKGISRGDRDRINKLKKGISTDKKQSTKDRLMQLEANSIPESLSVYENYDKDDPSSSMLMPKALCSTSAEDVYWGTPDDEKESFIEDAISGINDYINKKKNMCSYEKKRHKTVFLWGLYKKLGYDVSLLPKDFLEKAERAEYKRAVPKALYDLTQEWDEKLKSQSFSNNMQICM